MLETGVQVTGLYVGLNILLTLCLAILVVRQRVKTKVLLGDNGVAVLQQAVRAHGNNIEYVPAGIGALIALTLLSASVWVLHAVGGLLFVGRVLHAIGLSASGGNSPGRSAGAALTWLSFLIAGVACLYYALR